MFVQSTVGRDWRERGHYFLTHYLLFKNLVDICHDAKAMLSKTTGPLAGIKSPNGRSTLPCSSAWPYYHVACYGFIFVCVFVYFMLPFGSMYVL